VNRRRTRKKPTASSSATTDHDIGRGVTSEQALE
jgi:hypothetical protein